LTLLRKYLLSDLIFVAEVLFLGIWEQINNFDFNQNIIFLPVSAKK